MNSKKNFFDIIAMIAGVKNIEWNKEFETYEIDDYFWDNSDLSIMSKTVFVKESRGVS